MYTNIIINMKSELKLYNFETLKNQYKQEYYNSNDYIKFNNVKDCIIYFTYLFHIVNDSVYK
jgi:hypothetical protein